MTRRKGKRRGPPGRPAGRRCCPVRLPEPAAVTFEGWSEGELRASQMLVHNSVLDSQGWDVVWPVRDAEFQEHVIAILARAEPFRPALTSEQVYSPDGYTSYPSYAIFQLGNRCYTSAFATLDRVLSREFLYRDTPVICLGEYELTADGRPAGEGAWYCSLPAEEFATLVDLLMRYSSDYCITI